MPMVNANQARIELSAAQAEALADVIVGPDEGGRELPPMIWIEETNLGTTVAVGGKGLPWTLIDHYGEVHEMREPVK